MNIQVLPSSKIAEKVMFSHIRKFEYGPPKFGHRDGTLAIKVVGNKCYYALALTHPKDQFCKLTGREVAEKKLMANIDSNTSFITIENISQELYYLLSHSLRADSNTLASIAALSFKDVKISYIFRYIRLRLNLHPRAEYVSSAKVYDRARSLY
jgi:hypothetical protein